MCFSNVGVASDVCLFKAELQAYTNASSVPAKQSLQQNEMHRERNSTIVCVQTHDQ